MAWLGYIVGGIALGAVILAIYEWRKGRRIRLDPPTHDAKLSERGAYTQSERIRAEGVFLPGSSSGPH